jgi:hypothetical protein
MAKRFMFVCLGVLALALAYHLGAQTATSEPGEKPIALGMYYTNYSVLTDYGNIYAYQYNGSSWGWQLQASWTGSPTPIQSSTWGSIKAQSGK